MNLKDPDQPVLFSLPYEISAADQTSILNYAYEHAGSWSGQTQVWDSDQQRYEPQDYFGRLQITRLSAQSREALGDHDSDWLNWAVRLDPEQNWEWIDTPITELVKKYVDQIRHLYLRFHRVLILVQKPGSKIPLHTDRVVRNCYEGHLFAPGPAQSLPLEDQDLHWQCNRYLALKWPLTVQTGDNGRPLIEIQGRVYRYDVGRQLFAINEVEVRHGAGAVDHRRGVIFLDGILDYRRLCEESWNSVTLEPIAVDKI